MPSFWSLRNICKSPKIKEAQKSGKFTVLFDSGIRTGSDIIKVIAAGAQGVMRTYYVVELVSLGVVFNIAMHYHRNRVFV